MISVVIPIYNGEKYLKACIDSILAQTFTDWEIVVSDDGSTDESLAIVDKFNDSRIRIVKNETGRGIFKNLNNAILHSSGTYIQIFNQDDVMWPRLLEEQVNKLQKWPTAGMVFCRKNAINENGDSIVTKTSNKTKEYQSIIPELIESKVAYQYFTSFGCFPGNLSPVMITRTAWIETGLFNTEYPFAGDFEYWIRLSQKFDIVFNNQDLCNVRTHKQRASQILSEKDLQLVRQLFHIGNSLLEMYTNQSEKKAALKYLQKTIGAHSFHQVVLFLIRRKFRTAIQGLTFFKGVFSPVKLVGPYILFVILKLDIKQYPIYKSQVIHECFS